MRAMINFIPRHHLLKIAEKTNFKYLFKPTFKPKNIFGMKSGVQISLCQKAIQFQIYLFYNKKMFSVQRNTLRSSVCLLFNFKINKLCLNFVAKLFVSQREANLAIYLFVNKKLSGC